MSNLTRIDYHIEKYQFAEVGETPRIARQWETVLAECQRKTAGSEERLRTALLSVDYATSFELPFRLLLVRTPQLVDKLRKELDIYQKPVTINGKKRGTVYSLNADFSCVPDEFRYRLANRIRRVSTDGSTAAPFQRVAKQVKDPRERLKLALESNLCVNALDGMFWLGLQRIAADIAVLRKSGLEISTNEVEVFDTQTGTTRAVSSYQLCGC